MESENLKQLNIIVKADVQGTAQALKQSLEKLSNDEVKVKVIHAVAGAVTESDVQLAKAGKCIIIGVNDHLEIWDEDAFNSYLDDNASSLEDIAENLFDEKDAL